MKREILLIMAVAFFTNAEAQYKKSNFLNKKGRIYDIGTSSRILGGGRSMAFGFFLSYGKESDEKRIHHWYDTEIMIGSRFSYSTTAAGTSEKLQVNGKSGIGFTLRYNLAYFLLDNSNKENKLLPFINLGIGYSRIALSDDYFTYTPNNIGYPNQEPQYRDLDFSFGAGAGIIYRFNQNLGLRFSAMYNAMLGDIQSNPWGDFIITPNHPAVNLAIRFRMDRDE